MKSRMLRGLLPYNKNPEGSAAGGKGPRRRRVVDYREGKRKARRVGEKTSTSAGPDGKPASAPLLPAPAALEPAPAPAFVHDSGPSAFTSEGQSALSSSAPVYSVGTKFKKRFPGYGVWTCTIAAIQEDGTYLGAYEDGTVKTYTANEIAKYLKQAEKLDAQEKRSAESPAQAGVGKTGQASAAKRLPARTPSSTSSPTCALPLRPPRPVASQASNAAQGTRPSSPSAGCSSIIELVEHASTRRNGSDSSAAQGGGRARRAMLASAPAPSYPPVGDTFEPGMVGLENLGNTCFMNATLQSLLFSRNFIDRMLRLRRSRIGHLLVATTPPSLKKPKRKSRGRPTSKRTKRKSNIAAEADANKLLAGWMKSTNKALMNSKEPKADKSSAGGKKTGQESTGSAGGDLARGSSQDLNPSYPSSSSSMALVSSASLSPTTSSADASLSHENAKPAVGTNDNLIHGELYFLIDALWKGSYGTLPLPKYPQHVWSPHSLFYTIVDEIPHFGGNQQQDAHEFLRFLLDRLDIEFTSAHKAANTRLPRMMGTINSCADAFTGTAISRVTCGRCNHTVETLQPFLDISVDIPERKFFVQIIREGSQIGSDVDAKSDEDEARGGAQIDRSIEYRARQMSLHDCLRRYTRVEPLRWTEPYNCAECRRIKLEKQVSKAGATGTDPSADAAAAATSDSMSSAHHSWRKIYEGVRMRSYSEISRGDSPFVGVQPTTKQIQIMRTPQILVIHFKRLEAQYGFHQQPWRKNRRYVSYPLRNLDISAYISKTQKVEEEEDEGQNSEDFGDEFGFIPSGIAEGSESESGKSGSESSNKTSETHPAFLYNLVSVIIHHGTLATNGHYSCFVYNASKDQWTHRNDSRVRIVSEEFVAQQEAYLLIYERQALVGENYIGGMEIASNDNTSEDEDDE